MNRRFPKLPDAKYLTPRILELDAEAHDLVAQISEAQRKANAFRDNVELDKAAADADVVAAGVALRKGQPASSAGTPNLDKLKAERTAAHAHVEALASAAYQVEDDMVAEFAKLWENPKTNGIATRDTAAVKYRKAIDALAAARAEFVDAQGWVVYVERAANLTGKPEHFVSFGGLKMTADPGVTVNQIDTSGELGSQMRPVSATHLLESTFGLDLAPTT